MGCPRCPRGRTEPVLFDHRRVTACRDCHHISWEDDFPDRLPSFAQHLRCLQEEVKAAEEEQDDMAEPVQVEVTAAQAAPGDHARLQAQVVEGDPQRFRKGAQWDAIRESGSGAGEATVTVLSRSRGALRLLADARSWGALPEGSRLRLEARSNARLQRTLLQAYLLARRMDPWHGQLEHPERIGRIPRVPPEGVFTEGLRPSQARAVRAALSLEPGGLLMVQGPPGTGKTTVIAQMVRNLLKRRSAVLVTAHTHVAIDNVLRRLLRANPVLERSVVRIGEAGSVAADLGHLVRPLSDFVEPPEEPDARPLWQSVWEERPVVAMTLDALAAAMVRYRDRETRPFPLCVVDEAAMNLQPKLALARAAGERLVLVGDPQQLPPIVRARSFRDDPVYRRSPFEAMQRARGDLAVLLDEQFRCHPDLYQWSADTVYGGRVASRREPPATVPELLGQDLGCAVAWVDTAGLPGNRDHRVGTSRANPVQAVAAARVVAELVREHGFPRDDVCVITPFRAQATLYSEMVRRSGWRDADVVASTVDAFQGDERRAVVLDLTTTAPARPHQDVRRLNVSLTRAQDFLAVVGPRLFVGRPAENPWLWSLQNWSVPRVVPFPAHLAGEPAVRAAEAALDALRSGRLGVGRRAAAVPAPVRVRG